MPGAIAIFRLAFFTAGLIAMLAIETLRPKRAWTDTRKIRLAMHLTLAIFNTAILRFIAVIPLLYLGEYAYTQGWGLLAAVGLRGYPEIIAGLVVMDMLDYWWHRFNHRIGFLWRFHKVHHVDTHVDVTTSLRFHPGELFISSAFKALWVVVLGPSAVAFVVFESLLTLASQFHHSNIDFSDRTELRLRKIVVTPRYHASHHTVSRRTGDANFAAIFIIWDKLFASYREPDYEEMKMLGLERGRDTYLSFSKTLKAPFISLY